MLFKGEDEELCLQFLILQIHIFLPALELNVFPLNVYLTVQESLCEMLLQLYHWSSRK